MHLGPMGVPSLSFTISLINSLFAKPATSFQVIPPSSDLKNPCGEVPAYHTSGSELWPGVTQKMKFTDRSLFSNVGGLFASVQVFPESSDKSKIAFESFFLVCSGET